MASEKDFAVVFFEKENTYSEIPVSWLTFDKTQCWWPNTFNPRNHMKNGNIPNSSSDDTIWTLHNINLESYASTLESARRKAEEPDYVTGNEELVVGPRQRKPKNFDSGSSCSENLTPPPSPKSSFRPKEKKKASKKSLKTIKDKINGKSRIPESEVFSAISAEPIFEVNSPIVVESPDKENAQINVTNFETGFESNGNNDIPVILLNKENPTVADLYAEMKQLSITCNTIHNYMIAIDKRLKALTLEKGNLEMNQDLENLMNRLPCKTNEEVEIFDQDITNNEEFKKTFIQYIKRIGGKDIKDNVNRCLPYIFTNELGTHCSYVGFRGNFKLQHFAFMKIFVEMVMLQHQCTLHEVEKCIGEWFRLSNQRQKREKKN